MIGFELKATSSTHSDFNFSSSGWWEDWGKGRFHSGNQYDSIAQKAQTKNISFSLTITIDTNRRSQGVLKGTGEITLVEQLKKVMDDLKVGGAVMEAIQDAVENYIDKLKQGESGSLDIVINL